jgi:UDP-glucose 4-epimerase
MSTRENLEGIRVLVTGAAGFIGSHLSRELVKRCAEVFLIDKPGISTTRIKDILDEVRIHYIDITDFSSLKNCIREINPQKIFHLAAHVDVTRDWNIVEKMINVNIKGTLNLLKSLDGVNYDCFVNTGTSEEYGDNPAPFHENQIPNPVSPYSASKVATTMFCQMLYKTRDLPVVTVRPSLTYGPGQDSQMLIPALIKNVSKGKPFKMTKGEQTREFNYIDDTVQGFILAGITPQAVGEVINLGGGVEYKIKDVVEMILNLMGSPVRVEIGALSYRPGETMHFYCSNEKAKKILDWRPTVPLKVGLKRTINWYKNEFS